MRRKIIALLILVMTSIVVILHTGIDGTDSFLVSDYYVQNAYVQTSAENVVTAIYLVYRYYDTLFEALMLLFSIIAIIYLSVHEEEKDYE